MTTPRIPLATREIPTIYDVNTPWYRVTISRGIIDSAGVLVEGESPAHRYVIIADATVASIYGDRVLASFSTTPAMITVPPGEQHKTREQWASLTDTLLGKGYGRDTLIVALGGGVVGDLAGFVAATYMRGIAFAQIPTTLLAMVDASIGGKTGVDLPAGKNLIGAFHRPAAVVIDPDVLGTLPEAHRRGGLAEMIKHGVVADRAYLDRVVDASGGIASGAVAMDVTASLIARSVEIKRDIVTRDEREDGLRKVLNFGHTVAHALETVSGFSIAHGNAVAIGMCLEARIAERARVARPGLEQQITAAVTAVGLPCTLPASTDLDQLLEAMRTDKKARRSRVEFALPSALGEMAGADRGYGTPIQEALVRAALA